jgi:AcrR family transcriptional regulator
MNADADATRARILESALQLFSAHGIDGASIREVAKGAGVSLAMVHHYFGSKDDLHRAVLGKMYVELAAMRVTLERALATAGSVDEVIESAVVAGYRFAREHVTEVRLMLRAAVVAGELPEEGRTSLVLFLAGASERLAAVVGRPARDLRLPLQSAIFLVARYAVQGDAELALVTGAEDATGAHELVERHLVSLARTLLLQPTPSPSRPRTSPNRAH